MLSSGRIIFLDQVDLLSIRVLVTDHFSTKASPIPAPRDFF
jgi:hypothetical protein